MYIQTVSKDDWRKLRVEALTFAKRIISPHERAETVTQEAFARLYQGRPFDESKIDGFDALSPEAKRKALELHLLGIVRSLVSTEKASASRRRSYEKLAGREHNALTGETDPSPETVMVESEDRAREFAGASRKYDKLRAMLAGQTLELDVCDALGEGLVKPAELARRLKRSRDEVAVALRRVRRLMGTIVAAEGGEAYEEESP